MLDRLRISPWLIAGITALMAAVVVLVAPRERTLGDGIRAVYIHVPFVWTGMVGLAASGVVGLALAITGRARLHAWLRAIGWVTLGALVAALLTGMVAAQINWGGVFWDEPLMILLVRALLIFAAAHIAGGWLPSVRLSGLLVSAASAIIMLMLRFSPQILHPGNAVASSSSVGIRLTFGVMFALLITVAGYVVVLVRKRILLDSPSPPVA